MRLRPAIQSLCLCLLVCPTARASELPNSHIENDRSSLRPYQQLIETHKKENRLSEALQYLGESIKQEPHNANAYWALGSIYRTQGLYERALEKLDVAQRMNSELLEAYEEKAIIYHHTGRFREAIRVREEGMVIAVKKKDLVFESKFLNNIGLVYSSQGDYLKALDYHQKALRIREQLSDLTAVSTILNAIGVAYYHLNDYHNALTHYHASLEISRKLAKSSLEEIALANLGCVYSDLGEYAKALEYYQRSLHVSKEIGDELETGRILHNLGLLHTERGDYTQAVNTLQQALKILKQSEKRSWEAITLGDLGGLYQNLGNYRKAIHFYQLSLQTSGEIEDKKQTGYALYGLASIFAAQDSHLKAIQYYENALMLAREIMHPDLIWRSHFGLAHVFEKTKHLEEALAHYTKSITSFESMRTNLKVEEFRSAFLENKIEAYKDICHLLLRMHKNKPTADYDQRAFHYAERAKARTFLELLGESQKDHLKETNSELAQKERLASERISKLQSLIWEWSSETATSNKTKVLEQELLKAQEEFDRIKLQMHQKSPEATLISSQPITVHQAQGLLDGKTALLEYLVGEKISYLFVITASNFATYPLAKRSDIAPAVEKFSRTLSQAPSSYNALAYLDEASTLYGMLIKPAEAILQGLQSLIIVPDDKLALLPFAALLTRPTEVRRTVRFSSLPYLMKRYEISSVQSASVLSYLRANPRSETKPEKDLVVFADPIYEAEKRPEQRAVLTRQSSRRHYRSGRELSRIEYTAMEASQIARVFGERATTYLREQATEERVKSENLKQYRYIHFAVHGVVNPQRPGFAALVLGHEKTEDGLLHLIEVSHLDLNADLVVLSACDSGVGASMRGEGLIGLARGFMYAGARSVLASLWRIEDSPATATFMYAFYRRLTHESKAAALRHTQLEFINHEPHAHPFYWAPFVLIGEGAISN